MSRATFASAVAGGASVLFLVLMLVTGSLPQQHQLVKFEAKGVMQLEPERITRVALRTETRAGELTRSPGDRWRRENGEPLDAAANKHLSMAVQFMNTSGPVRVLEPDEYKATDLNPFGLDRPRLSVMLFEGDRPVFGARFGGRNPDGMLEYVMVEGRQQLFLLSRFVGEEWDAAAKAALAR